MTRKSVLMGMIGILIFFGIAVVEVSAQAKTLVINGITEHSGDVMAVLASNNNDLTGSMVAVAQGRIANNSLSFQLVQAANERQRWTGSGEYFIVLIFEGSGNAIYYYTQGGRAALKYNVAQATTTIAYNQFSTNSTTGANSNSGPAPNRANNNPKTLAITGITGHSGNVMAVLVSNNNDLTGSMVALAQASIARNGLTFQLVQAANEKQRWTDSGEYYIVLIFEGSGNAIYYYTQGGRAAVRYNVAETTTTLAYNQFIQLNTDNSRGGGATSPASNSNTSNTSASSSTYIITGSGTSFSAAKGGAATRGASGAIQAVIDGIKTDSKGADVSIQFGDGKTPLNIGNTFIDFNGSDWGIITIGGKLTASPTIVGESHFVVRVTGGNRAIINADITNTSTQSNGQTLLIGNSTADSPTGQTQTPADGTVTITGGTITSAKGNGIRFSNGSLTINDGTITGGDAGIQHYAGASNRNNLNITGGTVIGQSSGAIYLNNNTNRLTVTGGTIRGTGNAAAISTASGPTIELSVAQGKTTLITAECVPGTTNRATIRFAGSSARATLTIGAGVRITNTNANGKLLFSNNANNVITNNSGIQLN